MPGEMYVVDEIKAAVLDISFGYFELVGHGVPAVLRGKRRYERGRQYEKREEVHDYIRGRNICNITNIFCAAAVKGAEKIE